MRPAHVKLARRARILSLSIGGAACFTTNVGSDVVADRMGFCSIEFMCRLGSLLMIRARDKPWSLQEHTRHNGAIMDDDHIWVQHSCQQRAGFLVDVEQHLLYC